MSKNQLLADIGESMSETLKPKSKSFPEELRWIYKWFMPTDESPIALGEFEVSVGSDKIIWRLATGLKIEDLELSLLELEPMSDEEIAEIYQNGSDAKSMALQWGKFCWFKHQNGLSFIFTLNPSKNDLGLVVRWSMADYLGPTILYNPSQVRQWVFKSAVRKIMLTWWDFPRLKHEGRNLPKRSYFKRVACLEI